MSELNKKTEIINNPFPLGIEGANRWACLEDRIPGAMKLLAEQYALQQKGEDSPPTVRAVEPMVGGVLVIPVKGFIFSKASLARGSFGQDTFRAQLRAAAANPDISAIVLDIDSPGGMADGAQETAEVIREVRAIKPVIAFTDSLAASAAYYIASQAGEIVIGRDALVGSIGTLIVHGDFSKMFEDFGINITIVRNPSRKAEGNSFEPLSEEAQARFQQIVDLSTSQFQDDVSKGRGIPVTTIRSDFGQGILLMAKEAKAVGMVDRIESMDALLSRMARGGRSRKTRADGESMVVVASEDDGEGSNVQQDDEQPSQHDAQRETERARALDLDFKG